MFIESRINQRDFSRFAGENVGPLDHDDSDKVSRLSIENTFSSICNISPTDFAIGVEDIKWEHIIRDVSTIHTGTIDTSEIDLVIDC